MRIPGSNPMELRDVSAFFVWPYKFWESSLKKSRHVNTWWVPPNFCGSWVMVIDSIFHHYHNDIIPYDGFHTWAYPKCLVYNGTSNLKWMILGGTQKKIRKPPYLFTSHVYPWMIPFVVLVRGNYQWKSSQSRRLSRRLVLGIHFAPGAWLQWANHF